MRSPSDQCDIDVRVYNSSSEYFAGFSYQHSQIYSIIADGVCRDSRSDDMGYYIATCDSDTDWFRLSRAGCTDETYIDCTDTNVFSGKNQEEGCMIDWTVSGLDQPGSVPFSAVADGECHDSGTGGLGHYEATCHDEGDWFELSRSGCTEGTCSECTGTSEDKGSPLRRVAGQLQCAVDAFYKEEVWSISGRCQRSGCSGSCVPTLPTKWWPSDVSGKSLQCIYGDDYPEEYHLNGKLRETLLFDSRDECYEAYARVKACQPTARPSMSPGMIGNANSKNNAFIPVTTLVFILLFSSQLIHF